MKRIKRVQHFNKFSHENPKMVYTLNDIVLQLEERLQARQLTQEIRLSNQLLEFKKDIQAQQLAQQLAQQIWLSNLQKDMKDHRLQFKKDIDTIFNYFACKIAILVTTSVLGVVSLYVHLTY
jgi:hypothetical protein